MTDELKLLKGDDFILDDVIEIHHPKLSEISAYGERKYYSLVSTICATPSDYKSILLDNYNVDYEEVGDFEFFLMMWNSLIDTDLTILFPKIVVKNFRIFKKEEDSSFGLYNEKDDIYIDEKIYTDLVEYIRKIHGFTKHEDKSGNESTKKYLIKKARKELQNSKNKTYESTLAPLISSMVNSKGFKYDYETVWSLNIYQFMDSVKRIQKIKGVDNILFGIYTGNVDQKKISKDALDWLGKMN